MVSNCNLRRGTAQSPPRESLSRGPAKDPIPGECLHRGVQVLKPRSISGMRTSMRGLLRPSDLSSAPRAAAFAVLVVLGVFVHSASARLTVMHGFVYYTSALVWIQADAPGPVEVVWRTEGDDRERRTTLDARAADDNVVIARLTGLLPGRTVSYAISGDGDRREGTLRTQPRWTRPADAPDIASAIGS